MRAWKEELLNSKRRDSSENTESPRKQARSKKSKAVLLIKEFFDALIRSRNRLDLGTKTKNDTYLKIADVQKGLSEGLGLSENKVQDILAQIRLEKNAAAPYAVVMDVVSQSIIGTPWPSGNKTSSQMSALNAALRSKHHVEERKYNTDLCHRRPRIDEITNDRILGLARRCQELEQEKANFRKKLQRSRSETEEIAKQLSEAKKMLKDICHRCSMEKKTAQSLNDRIDSLQSELAVTRETLSQTRTRLRRNVIAQRIARTRMIETKDKSVEMDKTYKQKLRKLLQDKTRNDREVALLRQMVKQKSKMNEKEMRHLQGRMQLTLSKCDDVCDSRDGPVQESMNLKRLLEDKEAEKKDAVLRVNKELAALKASFDEKVLLATADAKKRAENISNAAKRCETEVQRVTKERDELKARFACKERELERAKRAIKTWTFEKEDLHRELRGSQLKCKQLKVELQRVQQTAVYEMRRRKTAIREKCAIHVENCDLKARLARLRSNSGYKALTESTGVGGLDWRFQKPQISHP